MKIDGFSFQMPVLPDQTKDKKDIYALDIKIDSPPHHEPLQRATSDGCYSTQSGCYSTDSGCYGTQSGCRQTDSGC